MRLGTPAYTVRSDSSTPAGNACLSFSLIDMLDEIRRALALRRRSEGDNWVTLDSVSTRYQITAESSPE